MKKIITTAFLLLPLLSIAQFNKRDKFLGGSLSFHSDRSPSSNSVQTITSFSAEPSLGFFLSENLAIGGYVGYSSSDRSYSVVKYNSKILSTGVFAKRFFKISDKFFFTLIGNLYYNRGIDESISSSNKNKTQTYSLGTYISPSFIFFPSRKWGIEASLGSMGYSHSQNLSTNEKDDSFDFSLGTFSLGFSYYFRKAGE